MAAESPDAPPKTSFIYYGWIIVGLGFVTLAVQIFARFSFAIFQKPLIDEFGWSRGLLGGAYSLALLVYAVCCPYAGSLLEKKGPRAIMPWGCVLVGLAFMGGYFISALWHVYFLFGIVAGLGVVLNGFAANSAILPRWFLQKRGRATGITLSGIGIGILVLSPITEEMITHWGWRGAYLGFGAFVLCVMAPASYFILRDRPEDVGQVRDGLPNHAQNSSAFQNNFVPHASASEAAVWKVFSTLRGDIRFWAMLFMYFAIGFNNNTIFSQLHLYLTDAQFSAAVAAVIFGMVGFLRTVGSVIGGWVGDYLGRGQTTGYSAVLICIGIAILLALPPLGGGLILAYLFVLIYGLGVGGMSACASALNGDIFEGPTFAVIVGFVEICYGLGGVVGPPLAGAIFDVTGSYVFPFLLIIVFLLISIFVSYWLQRQVILQQQKVAA